MTVLLEAILILLILTNLRLLGSARLPAVIRAVALQGFLLGVLPLLIEEGGITWGLILTAAASTALKAGVFPWLLRRALRDAGVRLEVEPLVGYTASLLLGLLLLGLAIFLGDRLPALRAAGSAYFVPVALFTIMVGLFLLVSRKKAVTQVIGYLAMENGIYAFGMALAVQAPLIVEMGILLDVFVGVFVMGIMIFHINREFNHIDTDRLSLLKDGP